jgi:hypothetical protein
MGPKMFRDFYLVRKVTKLLITHHRLKLEKKIGTDLEPLEFLTFLDVRLTKFKKIKFY